MSDGTLNFDTSIDASGLNAGLSKIGNIASTGLKATGAILAGAATAITGLGAAAIKVGSDFEAEMDKVAAISGATGDEFRQLCDIAKEMGATTKFTATEAGQGLEYMAMAGWDAETSIAALPSVLNLAAAAGEDLATTSDIVTDAMTAFGLTEGDVAANTERFADVIAAASSNANTNVTMLGESFKYVAPVAGTLGFTAEDTALALGLMANSGIKASQAGTSLRGALTRLVKPTDQMQETMKELGLAVEKTEHVIDGSKIDKLQGKVADKTAAMQKAQISYNNAVAKYGADSAQAQKAAINLETAQRKLAETSGDLSAAQAGSNKVVGVTNVLMTDGNGKMRSFYEVMVELRKSFKGLTEEQKAQAAATLFGQEAMSGMLAIIDASDEDFEKLAKSIDESEGAAAEMAATMQDNLAGQVTILQSALEGLGLSVYESMQEPLKETAIMAQEWVGQLNEAFNEGGFEGLVSAAGDVIAQIAQKVAEAGPILINAAVGLISSFKDSLFENREAISSAGAELITALIEGLASAHEDIMITVVAIGSDILAKIAESAPEIVTAIVTACMNITEALADYTPDLLQAGADIIAAIANGIVDAIPTLATHATLILTDICNTLIQSIPILVDVVVQMVQAVVQALSEALPILLDGATTLFMSIVDALPVVIDQLLSALPDLITTIVDFVAGSLPQIVDAAVTMLLGLVDAIPNVITALVENLPEIIIAIVEALVNATPQIVEAAVKLFFGLIEAIPQIIVALVEAIPQIVIAIVETFIGLGPMLVDVGGNIIDWLVEGASSVWSNITDWFAEAIPNLINSITTFFEELPHKVGYAIGKIIGTLVEWNISVSEWIVTEVPKIVDSIVEWFKELPDRIAEWFNQTVDNLIQWGANFKENAGQKVEEICSGIADGFKDLPGKLTEIGGNLISGLIEGITGKAQDLWNSVTDFCGGIVDGFKDALGIHSPSTVMEEQAGYLVDGVVNGIADMPARALEAMSGVVAEVASWGAEMVSAGLSAATEFTTAVIGIVQTLPTQVATWLMDIITRVTVWAVNLRAKAISAATGFVNGVIEQISQLPAKVWTWLVDVVNKIIVWRTNLIEKGRAAAEGLCTSVIDGVKGLPDKMVEIGANIVKGIWEGISSGWDWLTDQIKKLADSLLETAKSALKINSPSRVFMMEVGRWIPPGISSGISLAMPSAIADLEDEMGVLVARAQASIVFDTIKTAAPIVDSANARAVREETTVINNYDYSTNVDNDFHVPVVSAAEMNKADRQTARKIYGGVK